MLRVQAPVLRTLSQPLASSLEKNRSVGLAKEW